MEVMYGICTSMDQNYEKNSKYTKLEPHQGSLKNRSPQAKLYVLDSMIPLI